ncbi:MAG: Bax inhibitor-1/YccA family protein [Candidatus Delongbacteria bacterium]|nr:Bax inhibitor-1/YccA family protein [Candidatus Delongbacteria bacterium]MCG2760408.1 Bax inhibitor-1/YccA family protein [Candidatus Delongbacteria bacterium]
MIQDRVISQEVAEEQRRFILSVYNWMMTALLVTTAVAYYVSTSESMINFMFGNPFIFFGLFIAELFAVGYLAIAVKKMSASRATFVFILYAALNGLTLSFIFLVYTQAAITSAFFTAAAMFGAMSFYGYTTKKDLTSWGSFFFMGLIGIVIGSVVNMFWANSALYWLVTYIGVFVFVGLTAYDTQKIKNMNIIGNEGTDEDKKEAIMGALTLYLDFINLFLMLLRIFGRRN